MYTYKTEPWTNIVATYEMFVSNGWQIQPMLDLTRLLATSSYASGLFSLTSMATLRIGRYPNFLPGDGELTIELAPLRQMFIFTYQSQPNRPTEWQHHYPIAEGTTAIKRFLYTYARWFSEPKNAERV